MMRIKSTIEYITLVVKRINQISAVIAMLLAACLILTMLYGVLLRYGFGAPPIWVFDVSYMLNGVLFLMATGYTLLQDEHVKIDFLSRLFPLRTQYAIHSLFYIAILIPAITFLLIKSGEQAWYAYINSKEASLSAWSPMVWPFYTGLFMGIAGLWLQLISDALSKGIMCISNNRD